MSFKNVARTKLAPRDEYPGYVDFPLICMVNSFPIGNLYSTIILVLDTTALFYIHS